LVKPDYAAFDRYRAKLTEKMRQERAELKRASTEAARETDRKLGLGS